MKPIQILLLDDHALVRAGMRLLIDEEPDLKVVAEAVNLREARTHLKSNPVDLVVMDYSLPGPNGDVLTEALLEEFSDLVILATTSSTEPRVIRAMLAAGAKGYLVKGASREEFLRAIRTTAAGQPFLSPEATTGLLRNFDPPIEPSPRELDVLRLIAEEYTTKEIAQRLHLSPKTVENHRTSLLQKVGARNVVGLVRFALRAGWIENKT